MSANLSVWLYADVVHSYSRGILRGIADYAKIHGGWNFKFHSRVEPHFAEELKQNQVAGVIIQVRQIEQAQVLRDLGIPAVNVANVLPQPPSLPAVLPDDRAVGAMAANYFLDRGFNHFAYCAWDDYRFSLARGEGFTETLAAAGHRVAHLPCGDELKPQRLQQISEMPRPLAIFCANDACARETVAEAVAIGNVVPDQIAVLGVDNDEINCELAGVPLSSIVLNTEQIGYEAASLLKRLMDGQPPPAQPVLIPPSEVITRRSSDVLALGDDQVAAVVRFIRDRGGREINVDDLLQQTRLSRRSLEMRFRKALGRSPYQEIRRVQLERAKLLLSRTDRPVREIADACGFKEARQLSTAFHDQIGVTPRQYRRRSRRPTAEADDPQPAN